MSDRCDYCEAYHWRVEMSDGAYELCCKKGDVELPFLQPPPAFLRELYKGRGPMATSFRQNIRAYNAAMTFTSVSFTADTRLDDSRGIKCFSIQGELYHYQGPIDDPGSTEVPAFAQLFFIDPDYAATVRGNRFTGLDPFILRGLHTTLMDCNPYISVYRTARERLQAQTGPLRVILSPQMKLIIESGADRRRENLPTALELAGLIPDEFSDASRRDIVLAVRGSGPPGQERLRRLPVTHGSYMPLHYVLLFPYGEPSWYYGMQLHDRQNRRRNLWLEQQPFYRFRLHPRDREPLTLFCIARLFQQYVVDIYVAYETSTLDWIRSNQTKLRADLYNGLADALNRNDASATNLGRKLILPSSFLGSDRHIQQLFQDSMAIVRHFGKPTLFITFTANPSWPEITCHLINSQQAIDRPDLIARIFSLKVKELIADLRNGILGSYAGYVYTIEYQKRGLLYMYLLLFLQGDDGKFETPERVNEVVSAELPLEPNLRMLVTSFMIHGLCGLDNLDSLCMQRRQPNDPLCCMKHFPKPFTEQTIITDDSYPDYRRRDDGQTFTVRKPGTDQDVILDNCWVVPYNPFLLNKFRVYINVEICATVQAIKYIHKYVYKGYDRTTLEVRTTTENDEIARYVYIRYVSPCEAVWRLFDYHTHQELPPVMPLAVHLPGEQVVSFQENIAIEDLADRVEEACSTLIGYFVYNAEHTDGRQYLYTQFPTHYTWSKATRTWAIREHHTRMIGRIYHYLPIAGECYYLQLLLTVVPGARSFTDLYHVDRVRYPTYQAACIACGLAENNKE
jgi:hypothetical protein